MASSRASALERSPVRQKPGQPLRRHCAHQPGSGVTQLGWTPRPTNRPGRTSSAIDPAHGARRAALAGAARLPRQAQRAAPPRVPVRGQRHDSAAEAEVTLTEQAHRGHSGQRCEVRAGADPCHGFGQPFQVKVCVTTHRPDDPRATRRRPVIVSVGSAGSRAYATAFTHHVNDRDPVNFTPSANICRCTRSTSGPHVITPAPARSRAPSRPGPYIGYTIVTIML